MKLLLDQLNLLNLNVFMFTGLVGGSLIVVPFGIFNGAKNNNWRILKAWGILAVVMITLYVAGFVYVGVYNEGFLVPDGQ